MENTNVFELISNLGHRVSASNYVIIYRKIFIQTVLYCGTSKETYLETWMRLFNKQKQRTQYNFLQILCHGNELLAERIISHIIGCIVPIKFSVTFISV